MYRKVLISGVAAAAIVGAGGTALALSGSDSTSGSPTSPTGTSSAQKHAGKHGDKHGKGGKGGEGGKLLKNLAHAQVVTKGKDGSFETHDLILGTVTAVSPTSITVQAADKTSETFAVTKDTKVRQRSAAKGKGTDSDISKIAKGDHVFVAGTGTSSYTANHIIDIAK